MKKQALSQQVIKYSRLKKRFHDEFDRAHSKDLGFNDEFGFPLHLHRNVCIANTNISFTPKLVIDHLPEDLSGKRVLDMGCGSGVLAITAAYKGASVVATDHDAVATNLTKKNVEANPSIADQVHVLESDLFSAPTLAMQKFDLILANLWFASNKPSEKKQNSLALGCYMRFLTDYKDYLKPEGIACLTSGECADFKGTEETMKTLGITPHKETANRPLFDEQVKLDWHLYSFDKNGQPKPLNG